MKQIEYALSIAVPIILAVVLIVFAVFAADIINAFLYSGISAEIIKSLKEQPDTGYWAITGAVIGSIVSILLLASYEGAKHYFRVARKDKSVINSIISELELCCAYIDGCKERVENEIKLMKGKPPKTYVSPPPRIEISLWALLEAHLPNAIFKDVNLLSGLRILDSYIVSFNRVLDSREQYHIHCKTNQKYYEELLNYSDELLLFLPDLREIADGLLSQVKKL